MNACKFPDLFKNEHINHMSIEDGCTYHENGQLASKDAFKDEELRLKIRNDDTIPF